jgi:hypothetical protein
MIVHDTKNASKCLNMLRIIEIDIRITEMHFEPEMKPAIFRAARDLFEGVIFERIHPAKPSQTVGKARNLCTSGL